MSRRARVAVSRRGRGQRGPDNARLAAASTPKRSRPSVKQLLGALGALVAVLAGMTSLADWITGRLGASTPATIDARILAADRQGPETLGAYLADTNQSLRGYTPAQLRQNGIVFALRIKLTGEKGQTFPLRWFIVDADRGERLAGRSYNQEPVVFRPRNDNHSRTWPVWVPYPPKPGRFRATFLLDDTKHQPVAQKTTRAFTTPGAQ